MSLNFLNLYFKNYLKKASNKKFFSNFIKKNFFYLPNFYNQTSFNVMNGNGGNGGNKKSRKFCGWNNNFFFLLIIMLAIFLFLLVLKCKITLKNSKKHEEIIIQNCELIPSSFFCTLFKLPLKKKVNHIEILKFSLIINRWYIDKNYLLSSINKLIYKKSVNSFQVIFLGYEPKIKNIIKNNKSKTKTSTITKMMHVLPGRYFKWSYISWKEFCSSKIFSNATFSTKFLFTQNGNNFVDIYIDFEENHSLIFKPGIDFENNNLSGFVSFDKKNIIGNGINFKGIFAKNYLNDFFLTLELKKFTCPKSKISISFEKSSNIYKKHLLKIIKICGKEFKDKIEIIISFSDKAKYFFQKKNFFISKVLFGYSLNLQNNPFFILPYFYIILNKNNNYLPHLKLDVKVRLSSNIFFLDKKYLHPELNLLSTLEVASYFLQIKKIILLKFYNKNKFRLLTLNQFKIPAGFYLNFNSKINKNFDFLLFLDLYKDLNDNKIIGKSIGFGFKLYNIINISAVVTSDGSSKFVIRTV